ncbi:MAG: hypothetical protein ABI131_00355 [Nostocoides sp.]
MNAHTNPIDSRDEQILAEVRDVYSRLDPVPVGLSDRVKYALTVRALHAELAELVDEASRAVRSDAPAAAVESLTFSSGTVSLMVSWAAVGDGNQIRLDGWVTRGGAEVDVVVAGRTTSVTTDAHGRFVVDPLPHGRFHFVVRANPLAPSERPIITPEVDL